MAVCLLGIALLPPASAAPGDTPAPLVALVARVIPSVVAIHTYRDLSAGDGSASTSVPKIERAVGSGFVVSPDGFIATNKHVVHGAYSVAVSLYDGQTLDAKVVWESSVIDVAFLKIETDRPLQAVTLARDGTLRVGQRVIAIGNPMGLGISASAGIVSAVNRNLDQSPYDDYVQTDAAVNPGNSGGPLFDLAGSVVGMNSILWTAAAGQGSQGLGFAIPAPDISFLIEQLKRNRRIECGTLGALSQEVTPAMGEALDVPGSYGVIVAGIEARSAAAEAGLRLGDVIQAFDGTRIEDSAKLHRLACLAVDRSVSLTIWRDGHIETLTVHPKTEDDGRAGPEHTTMPRFANAGDLGMTLARVDAPVRERYGLPAGERGFAIEAVVDSSEAAVAGLAAGDVIESLQMTPLSTRESFDDVLAGYGRDGRRHVVALVRSRGAERWVVLPVHLTGTP